MKDNKKGQAAMEFLMTYGWAILAAVIVIAVIAIYFRPSALVTNQAIIGAPFYGVGVTYDSTLDSVTVIVKNNGGEQLTINDVTISFSQPTAAACTLASGAGVLEAGSEVELVFGGVSGTNVCGLGAGNTVTADLAFDYTRSGAGSSSSLQLSGSVSGRVP